MVYGPGNPPPEFDLPELPADEETSNLRVIALQAAFRSVRTEPGTPAKQTYMRVLAAADEYLKWLRKDAGR